MSVFAQRPRNETFSFMTNNILFTAESVSWIATCMNFFIESPCQRLDSCTLFSSPSKSFFLQWTCNCKIPSQSSCMISMCNGCKYMVVANHCMVHMLNIQIHEQSAYQTL